MVLISALFDNAITLSFHASDEDQGTGSALCLNCRTSADIQSQGAQVDRVSHGRHAPNPQMRKVHLIFQA